MINELNAKVTYTFTRIGIIYSIFSVAATVLQIGILNILQLFVPDMMSMDFQISVSSACLYIVGLLVLGVGFSGRKISVTKPEKHSMKLVSFLKAFCMCYALLIISNLIGIAITTVIGVIKGSPIINPVEDMALQMSLPVMFLFTVVCAPIFEELFFRKLLVDRTIQFGEVPCMLLSGFMFGLFHGNLSQFPYAFTIGIFFAYLYIRTGRMIYPILMHAIVNFLGSVASVVLLKNVNYDALMQMNMTGSEEEILGSLMSVMLDKSFLILVIYEVFVFLLVVIGIILWILEYKKFRFEVQREALPKGDRFVMILGNPGMIAYIVIWMIMIVINTFFY